MSIRSKLLRQRKPKLWIGGLRDMLSRAQTYYALINMPLILITAYTVREATVNKYMPWLTLPVFFSFVILFVLTIIIIDYKIVYPSVIAFHQHEAWKHRSPVRLQLEKERRENKKRMLEIEKTLKRIEERLDGKR